MPSDQSRQALHDILENAWWHASSRPGSTRQVSPLTGARSTLLLACLEIISEASSRLDQSIRDRHPTLPWRAIMGSGNVYRHDYDNVAEDQLWRIVNNSLSVPIAAMEQELGARPK